MSRPHFLDSLSSGCLGALLKWSGLLGYYKGDFSETGYVLKSLTWIVTPLPSPPPCPPTHSVCRIALSPPTDRIVYSHVNMYPFVSTIIEVDKTCNMHLSRESVWRSLAFSSSRTYVRVNPSLVLVLLLTTCVTSGMTLNHYGPLCAIISNTTSKVPSPLDDLSFLSLTIPGTVCCLQMAI